MDELSITIVFVALITLATAVTTVARHTLRERKLKLLRLVRMKKSQSKTNVPAYLRRMELLAHSIMREINSIRR